MVKKEARTLITQHPLLDKLHNLENLFDYELGVLIDRISTEAA